ncbi:MAG: 4'-phosphopantetheinyl transferase superfamily protein [Methylococcales bacterium]|nr:4'-phosphopantetheinyl transferase superfamily protein [Methylococcales bacterium]
MIDVWRFDVTPKQTSQPFLRQVLSYYISENDFIIERGEFGKPYLRDFQELHFNVSHSGEKLLIAISNSPVGIDIERIKPRKSLDSLVKKCFALSEQNYWFALSENEKLTVFYDFWTRKEAVVKGIGRGIVLGLNRCEIDVNQPNNFLNLPISENWYTQKIGISPDYCVAVATSDANATLKFCSL